MQSIPLQKLAGEFRLIQAYSTKSFQFRLLCGNHIQPDLLARLLILFMMIDVAVPTKSKLAMILLTFL